MFFDPIMLNREIIVEVSFENHIYFTFPLLYKPHTTYNNNKLILYLVYYFLFIGMCLGFLLGFMMIVCIWDRNVTQKQKCGILVGIILQGVFSVPGGGKGHKKG